MQAPLASTTQRHQIAPLLVATWYPSPSVLTGDRCDGGVRAHRRGGHDGEARDELDHLAHRHVAVGIGAVVAIAGQAALPVGRQQPQRVPALAPPGVRHLAALEHHVIDRALAETSARRQAGVPGPDDDRGDPFDGCSLRCRWRFVQRTSTVTFTGLVMTSYTADRFCDCATIASISFFDASASILNVTLMSS